MENLHLKNLDLSHLRNRYNKNHKKTIPTHILNKFPNQPLPNITSYDKKLDDIVNDTLIYPTFKSKVLSTLKTFLMFTLTTAILTVVLYIFWEYIAKEIIEIISKLVNAI